MLTPSDSPQVRLRDEPAFGLYTLTSWSAAIERIHDDALVAWDRDMSDVRFPDDSESPHVRVRSQSPSAYRMVRGNPIFHPLRVTLGSVYWGIQKMTWRSRAHFVVVDSKGWWERERDYYENSPPRADPAFNPCCKYNCLQCEGERCANSVATENNGGTARPCIYRMHHEGACMPGPRVRR